MRRKVVSMKLQTYNAVIRKDEGWWIGWVEEIPGVNSQGKTRAELLKNLRSALREAIVMNREEARGLRQTPLPLGGLARRQLQAGPSGAPREIGARPRYRKPVRRPRQNRSMRR